jgi:imidazolonepropionase-like amidohydrolase
MISKLHILLCLTIIFSSLNVFARSKTIILNVEKYFDVYKGQYIFNKKIIIQNGIIKKISDNTFLKGVLNQKEITLTNLTLLPGLMDTHTHLFFFDSTYGEDFQQALFNNLKYDQSKRNNKFKSRAKSYLRSGFTTVRDLGNSGSFLDIIERDMNSFDTPRIFASGPGICNGVCQFPLKTSPNIVSLEYLPLTSKLKNVLPKALREHKRRKIDVLKIYADSEPGTEVYSLSQLKELVNWAHTKDILVASHSIYKSSVLNSINAGVDSIEHGYNLDQEIIKKLAKSKIFLVPTDISLKTNRLLNTRRKKPSSEDFLLKLDKKRKKRLYDAYKAGVQISGATDLYADFQKMGLDIGHHALETIIHYSESGIPNKEVLRMFTINSSILLRQPKLGRIEVGAFADFVAVAGDPLNNMSDIRNVSFVMKNGHILLNKTNPK